jgi:hypothetical protein
MVRARLTELFTLSRALEIEAKLGADVRARIARALSLGEQKADAADSLWENGHSAEALRLAIAAVDATLEAVPIYAAAIGLEGAGESAGAGKGESAGAGEGESAGAGESASSPPARGRGQGRAAPSAQALIAPTLRSRGVSPREIAAIEAALEAARSAPLPGHESEITAAHTTLWRRTTAAQHALGRALGQASRSRLELLRKRVGRISGAVLGVAAVITVLVLVLRRPEGVFIEASGIWAGAASYAPELAIDGRDDTLWLARRRRGHARCDDLSAATGAAAPVGQRDQPAAERSRDPRLPRRALRRRADRAGARGPAGSPRRRPGEHRAADRARARARSRRADPVRGADALPDRRRARRARVPLIEER